MIPMKAPMIHIRRLRRVGYEKQISSSSSRLPKTRSSSTSCSPHTFSFASTKRYRLVGSLLGSSFFRTGACFIGFSLRGVPQWG